MTEQSQTIRKIADALVGKHAPDHLLDLAFEEYHVRLASNSPTLLDELRAYYRVYVSRNITPNVVIRALQATPPAFDTPFTPLKREGGRSAKEEYLDLTDGRVVLKNRTGMVFLIGDDTNLVVGPCEDNPNQVVNFINHRYMMHHINLSSCVLFHAAAVSLESTGLALAGFAGAGKSTLALHMMSHNMRFISNDRLLVRRKPGATRMYGLAKWPRVNPGTILNNPILATLLSDEQRGRYEDMSGDSLWDLEDKYDVCIDTYFGPGRSALSGAMHALVILNWHRDHSPMTFRRINLADREDLAPAFVKGPGVLSDASTDPCAIRPFQAYLDVLSECDVYEITGGVHFDKACERCVSLLRGVTSP